MFIRWSLSPQSLRFLTQALSDPQFHPTDEFLTVFLKTLLYAMLIPLGTNQQWYILRRNYVWYEIILKSWNRKLFLRVIFSAGNNPIKALIILTSILASVKHVILLHDFCRLRNFSSFNTIEISRDYFKIPLILSYCFITGSYTVLLPSLSFRVFLIIILIIHGFWIVYTRR